MATNTTHSVGLTAIIPLTGLTAGSTTFTAKYKSSGGSTATFLNRYITVEGLP